MKVYLGGPMFVAAEVRDNLWLADLLWQHRFEVSCDPARWSGMLGLATDNRAFHINQFAVGGMQ